MLTDPLSSAFLKSTKMQNNSWYAFHRTQRLVKSYEDVFLESPVCVISVVVVNDAY